MFGVSAACSSCSPEPSGSSPPSSQKNEKNRTYSVSFPPPPSFPSPTISSATSLTPEATPPPLQKKSVSILPPHSLPPSNSPSSPRNDEHVTPNPIYSAPFFSRKDQAPFLSDQEEKVSSLSTLRKSLPPSLNSPRKLPSIAQKAVSIPSIPSPRSTNLVNTPRTLQQEALDKIDPSSPSSEHSIKSSHRFLSPLNLKEKTSSSSHSKNEPPLSSPRSHLPSLPLDSSDLSMKPYPDTPRFRKKKEIPPLLLSPSLFSPKAPEPSQPLSPRSNFLAMTPTFSAFRDTKTPFKEKKAATEIVNCLKQDPETTRVWALNQLTKYYALIGDEHLLRRWNRLFITLFLSPPCVPLIRDFIKSVDAAFDLFPKLIVDGLIKKGTSEFDIAHIFSLYTRADLKEQVEETMFRGAELSSKLYTLYGNKQLEDPFLDPMEGKIRHYWKRVNSAKELCTDYHHIEALLTEEDSEFKKRPFQECDELVKNRKAEHSKQFDLFAQNFLNFFYTNSPIPKEYRPLFSLRRTEIYKTLRQHFSQNEAHRRSAILIGEALFLRIINPFITTKISKDPVISSCLKDLGGVLQLLTNQAMSEEAESERPISPLFRKLYDTFLFDHQNYIEDNCPLDAESLSPEFEVIS